MEKITDDERMYYSLVQKAFKTLAPVYDIVALPLLRLRDTVVDFTGARNGSAILDVATGTGTQALAFASHGYAVTGIDLSEAMLQIAQKKNRYGNAKFEVGDATRLRFETNRFDVVCVSFALHDMPLTIREQALKEMVRAARLGGTIVIVDYALPENGLGRWLIYHLVRLYEGEYYRGFIHSDLKALLAKTGITITDELPVLLGAGRIWKGIKDEHQADFVQIDL